MIMIGIDPHKATHTAVAVDDHEVVLGELTVRASAVQAERLRRWADTFDDHRWAVEAANGLGYLLPQQLVAAGKTVFDVPPVLASRVREGAEERPPTTLGRSPLRHCVRTTLAGASR